MLLKFLFVGWFFIAGMSHAQALTDTVTATVGMPRTKVFTLKELGAWGPIKLVGKTAQRVLAFSVRADEQVAGAKLTLSFDYSPALSEDFSQLKVLINDRMVALDGLAKIRNLGSKREITIDASLLKDYNEIALSFLGNSPGTCVSLSALWLTVSDAKLELSLVPKPIGPDLRHLPAPFFDKRDTSLLELPFVFSKAPSLDTIKAAGIVASWFGMHAGYRGAQFPTFYDELPPGNAIVFISRDQEVAGFKGVKGSVLSVQQHPLNPQARVLIVNGNTDEELLRAARSLVKNPGTLTGRMATITSETSWATRKPYDAPLWIPTDRPVKVGEIAKSEELRAKGFKPEPIRINYRLPPDIFTWRTPGVPMQLKYRATPMPGTSLSILRVAHNDNLIEGIAIADPKASKDEQVRESLATLGGLRKSNIYIPPYSPQTRDQLQFQYAFDLLKEGDCPELAPEMLTSSVDAESVLDFSGFPRYVALPNLAYFANLGYPFTRIADLSETAVVMPEKFGSDEVSLYLAVMGRMGEATGLPAMSHEVITAAGVNNAAGKDILVIGSSQNQALFSVWGDKLPMVVDGASRRVRELKQSWRPTYRWEQSDIDPLAQNRGSITVSGPGTLVTVMGFQSPLSSSRSVVFMYADKPSDLKKIGDLLVDQERLPQVQGDFVILNDKNVQTTRASDTYYVGEIPWHTKLRWFLSDHPLLVALIALIFALLLAAIVYRPLKFLAYKIMKKV